MTKLPYLFDIKRIKEHIESETLILTPNNRLRSKILQAWGEYQAQQGQQVWQNPRIAVIEQWLNEQWQQLQAHAYPAAQHPIIRPEQQRVIWESITANCGLMQTEAVAKQAASAFTTLLRWNQPVANQNIDPQIDKQCRQWFAQYQQQLASLDLITPEHSYQIVGDAFDNGTLACEKQIYLLGFDDIAPLFVRVLDQASPQVTPIGTSDHEPHTLQRVECDSATAEMQAAARWARHILEQQASVRIGIIVPNLGQCREAIDYAFSAEFEAHSFAPTTERYTLPFNLSTGTPLGNTPLIASTIQLLHLSLPKQEWDVEWLSQCLLSPFWGSLEPFNSPEHSDEASDNSELEQRCALVEKLKSLGVFRINGNTLRYWAERIENKKENKSLKNNSLFNKLNKLNQLISAPTYPKKQRPSAWVNTFLEQLDLLYWPGERTPDSQEYQQTQLWYQLLEEFAKLDSVLNGISQQEALKQLQVMANQRPFQAKVPDSPIQILGILEGAGLHFTHCWVMGLHQQAWPPAAAPNALLPIRLQREHNMPHASSLRELQYAQSLTDNYRHCADTIIFSSPTHDDDSEQALLPSELIRDISVASIEEISAEEIATTGNSQADSLYSWKQALACQQTLDVVNCQQAPAFKDTTLPGGASFFKSQAENPFDSWVKYRLGASLPIELMNGFSHIERGNILHYSLAAIWEQLRTQAALLAISDSDLEALVTNQVAQAIRDVQRHKPQHLGTTLCQIEQDRQCALIHQWLETEKTRAPFTVVAIEEAHIIEFEGMTLTIRIDRVDQLADGRFLIIDYKTGESSVNAWKGERPKEPQLPLYALVYPYLQQQPQAHSTEDQIAANAANSSPIKGISFAQINVNHHGFKGLGDGDIAEGIMSIEKNRANLPQDWPSALAHWQSTLSALLEEFVKGQCRIHYNDDSSKRYARDFLRINRLYEADAMIEFMEKTRLEQQP